MNAAGVDPYREDSTAAELRARLDRVATEGVEGPAADSAAAQLEGLVDAIEGFLYAEVAADEAPGDTAG